MTNLTVSGKLLLGAELVPGSIMIAGDRIVEVIGRAGRADLEAPIVAPGFIDLQVNGGWGLEVDEDPASIRTLAQRLPETGVTAFAPTLISSAAPRYRECFAAYAAARGGDGARRLGLHIEGPFISPRRAGAHEIGLIEAADDTLFTELLASDAVTLMTLAPERAGALARIRGLRKRGVTVSLGHTDATYSEFIAGIDAGATMATHLYNTMSPFRHREPGAIGAVLDDDRIVTGLIADGVHSHPAAVRLAVKAKGFQRIALVTDMMPAAGMPPGIYLFGGQRVTLNGIVAQRDDGTLAGSVVTMDQAIRNMVAWCAATAAEALTMASTNPARLLGRSDLGTIATGAIADLVLLNDDLSVIGTIVAGRLLHRR